MAAPKTVWGLDIGKRAFKALKLRLVEGQVRVEALDIIEYPKIIKPEDPEGQAAIHNALTQFAARSNLSASAVALAVPGQSSFTRFVPLPPVEKRKIPDIVRFEAEQQIPFAIDDVVWRWQTFQDLDSPDVEVGIFAMKRADVALSIDHLTDAGMKVDIVQMAPLALYNFMRFDKQCAPDEATLLADVGTDKTDLVISDGSRIWTRTIQIGGNNFTEALVKTFKLSFAKAEKLKRTAATSKYARQIFQAMRPVFAELVQEMQRSVGYYTSLHRDTRFKKLIGLGNGFRLPGLQKFLEQNLNIPVARVDTYNRLQLSPDVNAPTFTENAPSFAVAYGLAVQGLELTDVITNLLPREIAHQRLWAKKKHWFVAAAAAILIALGLYLYRARSDRGLLAASTGANEAQRIVRRHAALDKELGRLEEVADKGVQQIEDKMKVFACRQYWPMALDLTLGSLNESFDDQSRLAVYSRYMSLEKKLRDKIARISRTEDVEKNLAPEEFDVLMERLGAKDTRQLAVKLDSVRDLAARPRQTRSLFFIETMQVKYFDDFEDAVEKVETDVTGTRRPTRGGKAGEIKKPEKRGFAVIMTLRTPLSRDMAVRVLNGVFRAAGERAEELPILALGRTRYQLIESGEMDRRPAASPEYKPEFNSMREPSRLRPAPPRTKGEDIKNRDPLFPNEDMSNDLLYVIGWPLSIEEPGRIAAPVSKPGEARPEDAQ